MSVKLLHEQHLEFLRLKGGCTGSSESTLVKIPHCWKSHVTAHYSFCNISIAGDTIDECESVDLYVLLHCHRFLPYSCK